MRFALRLFSNTFSTVSKSTLEQDLETFRRRRKTDWKRRQGGQSFLDNVIVTVRAGKGGNGCASFHREKYIPHGPPSGGNGGRGGDVYLLPTPELTTLSSVPKKIRGRNGSHGQGGWRNGRTGEPTVIRVPLGTVVRQLEWDDPRRAGDAWECEEEALKELEGAGDGGRQEKMRERRWVHYPGFRDANEGRDSFKEAEVGMYKLEKMRKFESRRKAMQERINLDLDKQVQQENDPSAEDAPLGTRKSHDRPLGYLIASGGSGGLGNPHFLTPTNRSPKFATRGQEGEHITLELELKIIADVGLVGKPNAGKSTLLRALTGGRVKTEVAGYAFTTLNPVVGIVRVAEDGTFEGSIGGGQNKIYDETWREKEIEERKRESGQYRDQMVVSDKDSSLIFPTPTKPGHSFDIHESYRFTISDNPGLISRASENVGLGHAFLRSLERARLLVYVVDLSCDAPWEDLEVLREELEKYKEGLSAKARVVVANKADLLAGDNETKVEEAKAKLKRLEEYVHVKMGLNDVKVVPISAKFAQHLEALVGVLGRFVRLERESETKEDV